MFLNIFFYRKPGNKGKRTDFDVKLHKYVPFSVCFTHVNIIICIDGY